jgi:hypothetical protein
MTTTTELLAKYDVPAGSAKREMYEVGRDRLLGAGYREIGLDQLPRSSLSSSAMDSSN